MEQPWWNRKLNSDGGTVMVEHHSGIVIVEQSWWNTRGGTVIVEQSWWNSDGEIVIVNSHSGIVLVKQ